MRQMRFKKELYSKTALIKAAYNFTDKAYVHLDADPLYYMVSIEQKLPDSHVTEQEFVNEMLTQSARHEVYLQTKDIRELLLARAMATSLVVPDELVSEEDSALVKEDEILKDWFSDDSTGC